MVGNLLQIREHQEPSQQELKPKRLARQPPDEDQNDEPGGEPREAGQEHRRMMALYR